MKKFKLIVKELKKKDGGVFNTYRAVQKNGTLIDCHFRKEVTPPAHTCFIEVENDKMNVSRNREYPVLWVSEISAVYEIDTEHSTNEIDDMF